MKQTALEMAASIRLANRFKIAISQNTPALFKQGVNHNSGMTSAAKNDHRWLHIT